MRKKLLAWGLVAVLCCRLGMSMLFANSAVAHAGESEVSETAAEMAEETADTTMEEMTAEIPEMTSEEEAEETSKEMTEETLQLSVDIMPLWVQPDTIPITNHGPTVYAGSSAGVYFYDYSTPYGNAYCIDSASPPVPSGSTLAYTRISDLPEDYRRALAYAVKYSGGMSRYTIQATFHMIENLLGYSAKWNPAWNGYMNFDVAAAKSLAAEAVAYRDAVSYERPYLTIQRDTNEWTEEKTFVLSVMAENCDTWTISLPPGVQASQMTGAMTSGTEITLTITDIAAYMASDRKITGLATQEFSPAEAILFATYNSEYQNYVVFDMEDVGRNSDPYVFELPAAASQFRLSKVVERLGAKSPEADAEFQIYSKQAGSYDTAAADKRDVLSTGVDGRAVSKLLPAGEYILHQIHSAEGTLSAPDQVITLPYSGEYKLVNQTKTGQAEIVKTMDRGAGEAESGAEFQVYIKTAGSYAAASNGERDILTTNESGTARTKQLPYGVYVFHQIRGAEGTLLCADFELEIGRVNGEVISQNIVNKVLKGQVSIEKYTTNPNDSTSTWIMEEGAVFRIYLKSAGSYNSASIHEKAELITDSLGKAISKDLPYGLYTVEQVPVPATANTIPAASWDVFIGKDKDGNAANDQTYHKSVCNEPYYQLLRVIKTDEETGKIVKLPGAVFRIKDSADRTLKDSDGKEEFVSDENGCVNIDKLALIPGVYYIEEIAAPAGFVRSEKRQSFSVSPLDSGKAIITVEYGQEIRTEKFPNKPQKLSISIEKSGEKVTSAEVCSFLDGDGEPVTDKAGNALAGVRFGYESVPLPGAVFEVLVGSRDISDFAEADGTPAIKRVDTDGDGVRETELKAGTSLGFIETSLMMVNGAEKAAASMENLPLDALTATAQYVVREVTAPAGFVLSPDEMIVDFSWGDQNQEIVMRSISAENSRQVNVISLLKEKEYGVWNDEARCYDWTLVPASDIVFGLFAAEEIRSEKDGGLLVEKDTLINVLLTDESGTAESAKDIPVGDYYVKELNGTTDVLLDEESVFTVSVQALPGLKNPYMVFAVNDGEAIVNHQIAGSLTIYKEAEDTRLPMQGVLFSLYDSYGNLIETLVTDEEGYAKTGILPKGQYTILETETLSGYLLSERHTIEIGVEPEQGERYSLQQLAIANRKMAEIRISKLTRDRKIPMNDVVFGIFDMETHEKIDEIVTGPDGVGTALVVPGEYYLKELATWDGFLLIPHPIPVSAAGNEVYKFDMTNDPTAVRIQKKDKGTGESLCGAEFKISDEKGKVLFFDLEDGIYYADERGDLDCVISDDKGDVVVRGLPLGAYHIREVAAPTGYILDEQEYSFSIEVTNGIENAVVVLLENEQESVLVVKTGETGNLRPLLMTGLAGALGGVYYLRKRRRGADCWKSA